MERSDALRQAEELVGRIMLGPANSRGYNDVGTKATSLAERTEAILRVAEWLLAGEQANGSQAGSILTAPEAP